MNYWPNNLNTDYSKYHRCYSVNLGSSQEVVTTLVLKQRKSTESIPSYNLFTVFSGLLGCVIMSYLSEV